MKPKAGIYVSNIEFLSGLSLALEPDSIVVFVGPNNSGKSATLKELFLRLYNNNHDWKIINGIEVKQQGILEDFLERLYSSKSGNQYLLNKGQGSHSEGSVKAAWNNVNGHQNILAQYLVSKLDTLDRLQLVNPPATADLYSRKVNHPIHLLQLDDQLELEFSKYFKLAFNEEITVNFGAGSTVPIHVGTRPIATAEHDRVSTKFQNELRKLGTLHEQGDGMKSFAGVFINLMTSNTSVDIIDEPEAFLHPPQAKILGQMIAKNLDSEKQLFIATHSEHFLKGLLEYADQRLVVVRLERDGTDCKTSVLQNSDLKSVWNDSILRHSNILDGLFHSGVILTESDSDSRFFSALLSTIINRESLPSADLHFIHSSGKPRFPVIIRALKKINVPLKVIGDFDLLNNESPLKEMFIAMGGDWNDIKKQFTIIKRDIDLQRPELNKTDLKKNLDDIFETISENVIPDEKLKKMQDSIKKASAWTKAKSVGNKMLTAGQATNAFNALIPLLEAVGIVILPMGEIEAFDKTVGGHGPKWVNSVLEKDLYLSADLVEAREFVREKLLK